MKCSLLIIVALLGVYTVWVQKTAREVIMMTSAREEDLIARLGCTEAALIRAESALAAAERELEKLSKSARSLNVQSPGKVVESAVSRYY